MRFSVDGLPRSRTAREFCSHPDEDVDGLTGVVELSVVASAAREPVFLDVGPQGLVGIHEYTIHDDRHTTAVALARAGIPLHILQRQLGHKHIEMTMKYATFHPDYNDVAPHFERMGRMLGLYSANGYDDVEGSSGGTLGNTPLQEGEMVGVERA